MKMEPYCTVRLKMFAKEMWYMEGANTALPKFKSYIFYQILEIFCQLKQKRYNKKQKM